MWTVASYVVLAVSAVAAGGVLWFLWRMRQVAKQEAPIAILTQNRDQKVRDWLISWLAMNRMVKAETINENTPITKGEIYGAIVVATYNHRLAMFVNNTDDIKTVGHLADLIEEQLDNDQLNQLK